MFIAVFIVVIDHDNKVDNKDNDYCDESKDARIP